MFIQRMALESLTSARNFLAAAGMWDGFPLHFKNEQAGEQERQDQHWLCFFSCELCLALLS
jgi:hypothetical protein